MTTSATGDPSGGGSLQEYWRADIVSAVVRREDPHDFDSKEHVEYQMKVARGVNSRESTIYRRYNDFNDLYNTLKSKAKFNSILPKFPPRSYSPFGPDKKFLETREKMLQALLDCLCNNESLRNDPDVEKFLGAPKNIPPSLPPITQFNQPTFVAMPAYLAAPPSAFGYDPYSQSTAGTGNTLRKLYTDPNATFVLPLTPPNLRVPEKYIHSRTGEECFVGLLLVDAHETLQQLNSCVTQLNKAYTELASDISEQLRSYEMVKDRIVLLITSLKNAQEGMDRLQSGIPTSALQTYIQSCLKTVTQSLNWASSMGETLENANYDQVPLKLAECQSKQAFFPPQVPTANTSLPQPSETVPQTPPPMLQPIPPSMLQPLPPVFVVPVTSAFDRPLDIHPPTEYPVSYPSAFISAPSISTTTSATSSTFTPTSTSTSTSTSTYTSTSSSTGTYSPTSASISAFQLAPVEPISTGASFSIGTVTSTPLSTTVSPSPAILPPIPTFPTSQTSSARPSAPVDSVPAQLPIQNITQQTDEQLLALVEQLSVQAASSASKTKEEIDKLTKDIKTVKKQISVSISRFVDNDDNENPALQRLQTAQQCLNDCIAAIDAQQRDPDELVEALGMRMYQLLAGVSEVDEKIRASRQRLEQENAASSTAATTTEAASHDEAPVLTPEQEHNMCVELHKQMLQLMRDMQQCHASISKRQVPPHILNKLEDLQENMADLEHRFGSSHGVEDSSTVIGNIFRTKMVLQAARQHEQVQDDLFGL